jgi:hypothetical protein
MRHKEENGFWFGEAWLDTHERVTKRNPFKGILKKTFQDQKIYAFSMYLNFNAVTRALSRTQ